MGNFKLCDSASDELVGIKLISLRDSRRGNSRLKTPHFGRIQAMPLPRGFKLDDSASNELVGVKFYDFFLIKNLELGFGANSDHCK